MGALVLGFYFATVLGVEGIARLFIAVIVGGAGIFFCNRLLLRKGLVTQEQLDAYYGRDR